MEKEPSQPKAKLGRFTWTQVIWFLVAWITLFAIGSLFISNPFFMEPSAGADINFAHAQYIHAVLAGMAGIIVLVACEIFQMRSQKVRKLILFFSVIMTILSGLGGIFDQSETNINWFWEIVHVIGLWCLDVMFIAFVIGLLMDLGKTAASRTFAYWVAIVAGFSLEFAAVMGHIGGWIETFGAHPSIIPLWAKYVGGEGVSDFEGNLIGSHSHEIVVAVLALLVAMVAWRFGYQSLKGGAQALAKVGLWLVMVGTIVMTIQYLIGGFTSIEPPTLFQFGPGGANGLASDDLVTGVGVMLGGLFVMWALLFKNRETQPTWNKTTLYSIAASWLLLVVTVVGAGYYIEFNEVVFGAGGNAPGAASDAVFTFAHQDYAFFLIPGTIAVMLIANLVLQNLEKAVSRSLLIGLFIAFIGVLTFVFFDPAIHGAGYVITAIGFLVVFIAALYFLQGLWKFTFTDQNTDSGVTIKQ